MHSWKSAILTSRNFPAADDRDIFLIWGIRLAGVAANSNLGHCNDRVFSDFAPFELSLIDFVTHEIDDEVY